MKNVGWMGEHFIVKGLLKANTCSVCILPLLCCDSLRCQVASQSFLEEAGGAKKS